MMSYTEAKAVRDTIQAECTRLSAVLATFPRNAIGITPDAVKLSPEYRQAKAAYTAAFERLRVVNAAMVRAYAKDMRADRDARRNAKLATLNERAA